MYRLLKNSLIDFKYSYKKYLSFTILYMLLTSIIFVPIISYLFNRVLKGVGTGSLLNAEVYQIGLTYSGILGMLAISFLAVLVLFIEFGVMISIAQKRFFNRDLYVAEAFVTTLSKTPKLLGFGLVYLVLILLLIIPFLDISSLPALLDINVPIILNTFYYEQAYLFVVLYVFFISIAIYFLIRWIFTLHYIFLENKTIWQAMKASLNLTKSNRLKIIVKVLLVNLLLYLFGMIFLSVVSLIPNITNNIFLGSMIEDYLITFSSYMMIIFTMLLIPINVIIITRLFFRYKKKQGDAIEDQLHTVGNKRLNHIESKITHFFNKRRFLLGALFLVYITGIVIINYSVNDNIVYLKWNVQVAAHRGDLMHAPENSISSIRSAIEKGVDAVEIDVMLTEDLEIILNHDEDLERVAGIQRRVADMTYDEIREVDIGKHFSEEFIGEGTPTLEEAILEVKDENVNLIIDIKVIDTSLNDIFAAKIIDLIEKYEIEDISYVQAFNYNILQEIRKINSDIKIGQILYLSAGDLSSLDVDFYTIRQTMLSERFIENAKSLDREVWVWTVNIERNIREVLKYDINGIITDYPERVQNVIGIDFTQE
ncbi:MULTISPECIES: glycerophosphoryl diester phosphodiesterase membrane domain-containing protein [Bacillaceae]|uniref:Glycerophosphoryl diester phosphodiesterase membrane domain-containing protein n=1 Tax=Evansella alkalicola TaxID=745819 RepID=A0ABS6JPX2_9BACI|nr:MULTISPECIES: glycerophosphoryl diester phosphodiesterase membrane domain-containing protein [Bacillaceae]MBU9720602.1 glycerophosphoryl diester phosphodiesterase membrane domain-containing protein [Bacillus alkalicola]